MKKVFLMLVAVATFALVSCGGSKDDKKAAPADGAAKSRKLPMLKRLVWLSLLSLVTL